MMTHHELVKRAAAWLKNKHPLVLTEVTSGAEIADALGFSTGPSTLIECKTSHSDFLADQKKASRKPSISYLGLGNFRFYMTEPGLLQPQELPDKWGLLEVHEHRIRIVKAAEWLQANTQRERSLLISCIRRLGHTNPPGVSIRFYTHETQRTATLSVDLREENQEAEFGPEI